MNTLNGRNISSSESSYNNADKFRVIISSNILEIMERDLTECGDCEKEVYICNMFQIQLMSDSWIEEIDWIMEYSAKFRELFSKTKDFNTIKRELYK